jgi:hypothetical protein
MVENGYKTGENRQNWLKMGKMGKKMGKMGGKWYKNG